MTTHRHERHWADPEKNKVYSRGLCGEDTWVEEVVDVEKWYFRQALNGSSLAALRAFDDMKPSIINDNPSAELSTCDECEALFGLRVLGSLS